MSPQRDGGRWHGWVGRFAAFRARVGVLLALFGWLGGEVSAEEGMWLFNQPPVGMVEDRYGFRLEKAWLDHLRESSVRFNTGGSGSFVSAEGLLLTNHHVGAGNIASLSSSERDLIREGFLARTRDEELPCKDLELNVLVSIRDVSSSVQAAVTPDMDSAEAVKARRAAIARLEVVDDEARAATRRDVVSLYQGAAYHLYEYRRYTDVRLVFAPEEAIAAFGGDADNFEYPRYCLDCCFFRAYENGVPAEVADFLKWSESGVKDGELLFVSGHPGSTQRGLTNAQVKAIRDVWLPYGLERLYRKEVNLAAWSARDLENARRARRSLTSVQNRRKARAGSLAGLQDPQSFARHAEAERIFRSRLLDDSAELAFVEIEEVVADQLEAGIRGSLLGGLDGFDSELFHLAWKLVDAAHESRKPDHERRSGYREADKVSFEMGLFSEDPIYPDLEAVKLGDSLTFLCSKLGVDDPMVVGIMAGKSPKKRALELVSGCGLNDLAARRQLYGQGMTAVERSDDPMVVLVRSIYDECRSFQKEYEEFRERLKPCHERIVKARFEMEGESGYPDASFSLRLSVGVAKGVGPEVPYRTNFGGLLERASSQGGKEPFNLPRRWTERAGELESEVAINFVSTNDITGGNSGSPVVNRAGELVGLIFDSNLDGLVNGVVYDEQRARAVSVDAGGIIESLESIYQADELVSEIRGGK